MKSREERIAWGDGYNAYQEFASVRENPYDPNTEEELFEAWKDGWYQAAYDS